MTGIQPELWADRPREAIAFYQAAFGARVVHQAGEGEDIVAQLAVGDAYFWVANTDPEGGRFSAAAIGSGTSRTLLVTGDPDYVISAARAAGATVTSPADDEHGWRLGRITDPFGHHWEIGTPIGSWPPLNNQHRAANCAPSCRSGRQPGSPECLSLSRPNGCSARGGGKQALASVTSLCLAGRASIAAARRFHAAAQIAHCKRS